MREENKIEELREKLYKVIENHGRDSPEVLRVSRELDKWILREIKKSLEAND